MVINGPSSSTTLILDLSVTLDQGRRERLGGLCKCMSSVLKPGARARFSLQNCGLNC